jgi:hypothetical protein
MTKAKKATFGVRHVALWTGSSNDEVLSDLVWLNEAKAIDRAIAAAVRKAVKAERDAIAEMLHRVPRGDMIAHEMRAWENAERMVRARANKKGAGR